MSRPNAAHSTDFRTRLKAVRDDQGLSQGDAAARIGATGAQWGNWERGVSRPSIDELLAICVAFGASAHWLLAGEGPRSALALASGFSESGEPLALESMSSEQLYDLAKRKARQEETLMQGPLREAVDHLREIVDRGEAPLERVRELLRRALREFDHDDQVDVVDPPVQKDGYIEQTVRTYERKRPDGHSPPSQRSSG